MTDKSKNTDKKKSTEDLDDMREAFRKHKERAAGGGGKNDWDKLGDGKNMRRVLPRPGERKFYTEGWTHFNVGPNNRAMRCIDEANIDDERGLPKSETKCPLCKKFLREQSRINSEYKKGDKDGHAEWKVAKDKYVPRHQFYANVLVPGDDDEGDVEIKILAFGPQVWSQLMNFYLGDDTSIGDFTKPKSGRWMNIKKEKKGGRDRRNIEYKVYPASDSDDISEAWDAILAGLHDLDAAVGKASSKDEMIAVMKGVDLNKGSDDDSGDDESSGKKKSRDDDDEEEERPSKKSKLGSKMKRRDDD
jgi:hypothetical protein